MEYLLCLCHGDIDRLLADTMYNFVVSWLHILAHWLQWKDEEVMAEFHTLAATGLMKTGIVQITDKSEKQSIIYAEFTLVKVHPTAKNFSMMCSYTSVLPSCVYFKFSDMVARWYASLQNEKCVLFRLKTL